MNLRTPAIYGFVILGSLAAVAFLGITRLSETFSGDQAMFTVFALAIADGAVLYRDIWDVKQPGIFLFYLAGGTLFGFSELGIHVFELVFWLLFSVVLIRGLNWYFRYWPLAAATPLFTVGVYYFAADSWRMTQVETLVGAPILYTVLVLLSAVHRSPGRGSPPMFFLGGLFCGAVILFKSAYLIVVVSIFAFLLLYYFRRLQTAPFTECFLAAAIFAAGAALPLLVTLVYFACHDTLPELFYVTFLYPGESVSMFSGWHRMRFLRLGLVWFFWNFLPIIVLGSIALVAGSARLLAVQRTHGNARASRLMPATRSGLFSVTLVLWMVVGSVAVLLQAASWWGYHLMLFFIPLGLLGVKGVEHIWDAVISLSGRTSRPRLAVAVAVVAILTFFAFTQLDNSLEMAKRAADRKGIKVFRPGFFQPAGDRIAKYEQVRQALAALPMAENESPDIFACANPLYYYLADTYPRIASNGWSPEFFPPRQWRRLEKDLAEGMPKFIVIDRPCKKLISINSVATLELLSDSYTEITVPDKSLWYIRKDAASNGLDDGLNIYR